MPDNRSDEWISADERLPEDHHYILFSHGKHIQSVFEGYLDRTESGRLIWFTTRIQPYGLGSNGLTEYVTHWMPLPQPPNRGPQ